LMGARPRGRRWLGIGLRSFSIAVIARSINPNDPAKW
jgi:hypothetical protein